MNCENAKPYYFEYLEGELTIPADVSEHLSQCRHCADEIERLRETLGAQQPSGQTLKPGFLKLHYQLAGQWVSCDTVRPLLPSLLAANFSANHHTPVTAHVDECDRCRAHLEVLSSLGLNRTQLLRVSRYWAGEADALEDFGAVQREALEQIQVQTGPGIQTRLSLSEQSDRVSEESWISDAYTLDVKRPAVQVEATPRRRPPHHRFALSAYVTGGIAAAVLLVVMLTLPPSVAKAFDLTQVYQSLESVKNVNIRVLSEDQEEIRNIWICEGLQARLFQQQENTVYWDERTGEIFRKDKDSTELISQNNQMELNRPWGLLPFTTVAELPVDRQWTYISDTEIEGVTVQIYELTWRQMRGSQQSIQKKWRGYLDINTHLPYRIEWTETVGEDFPAVELIMEVRYPSDEECLEAIQRDGFRLFSYIF